MSSVLGILMAGVVVGAAVPPQASPPIFQPGAPGAPSRVVTVEEARALGRSRFTADDVGFMQHMIVHHQQAVDMVALLETRGANDKVRLMGRRIALSQQAEMDLMRAWLAERGQSLDMAGMGHGGHGGMDHAAMGHGAHAGHGATVPPDDTPVMPGMLSPRQMRELAAARGPEFDRLFLEGMIRHHQGALDMVDGLMANPGAGEDTVLSDFLTSVVADQSAEILRMRLLLSEL